ncbi:hypothetical protein CLF_103219 [Clonorchis sinensis]|uniref:Uncharacterized protein n=1 Tax=Clonorchis sinensis TaxID=79923 RepID=G7Y9B9_CLOSI|nr:hypothetical protein CLF_103219 [Clonorchis sinensis]
MAEAIQAIASSRICYCIWSSALNALFGPQYFKCYLGVCESAENLIYEDLWICENLFVEWRTDDLFSKKDGDFPNARDNRASNMLQYILPGKPANDTTPT